MLPDGSRILLRLQKTPFANLKIKKLAGAADLLTRNVIIGAMLRYCTLY